MAFSLRLTQTKAQRRLRREQSHVLRVVIPIGFMKSSGRISPSELCQAILVSCYASKYKPLGLVLLSQAAIITVAQLTPLKGGFSFRYNVCRLMPKRRAACDILPLLLSSACRIARRESC